MKADPSKSKIQSDILRSIRKNKCYNRYAPGLAKEFLEADRIKWSLGQIGKW